MEQNLLSSEFIITQGRRFRVLMAREMDMQEQKKSKNEKIKSCCFLQGDNCRWFEKECPELYKADGKCERYKKGNALKNSEIDDLKKAEKLDPAVIAKLEEGAYEVFANIFTISIMLERDIYGDMAYCEELMRIKNVAKKDNKILDGAFEFIHLLANRMGCPVLWFFSMDNSSRKNYIYQLLDEYTCIFNGENYIKPYTPWLDVDEESQEVTGEIELDDFKNGRHYREKTTINDSEIVQQIPRESECRLVIKKIRYSDEKPIIYTLSYEPEYWGYNLESKYGYYGSQLYSEEEGKLAELFERIVTIEDPASEMEKKNISPDANGSSEEPGYPTGGSIETYKKKESSHKETFKNDQQKEERDNRGKIKKEVLRKAIYSDTKTVKLMDEFEGIGTDNIYVYERLEIPYAFHMFINGKYQSITLIVKRCRASECVGDITFTEFKQEKYDDLLKYVKDQIGDKIIKPSEIFSFEKPYHLRAQNSTNKTGFGWEWDWSDGYGSYTEGTFYGETTDYGFVGFYY